MCKKRYGLALLLSGILFGCWGGASLGEAGFVPSPDTPQPAIVTTIEAKSLPDDAWVVLQGYIERHIRKDRYLFRDDAGTITVEIDDEEWGGLVIGPTDKIEIHGEVDKDFNSLEIDVEHVRALHQ